MSNADNLARMRELIESLENENQTDILSILDSIKAYSPLPISVWRVRGDDAVLFSKGNGIIDEQANCMSKLFTCSNEKERLIEAHHEAMLTDTQDLVVSDSGRFFSIKLVRDRPSADEDTITGFAIDVSNIVRGLIKNDV
jgi:hypothetical protein